MVDPQLAQYIDSQDAPASVAQRDPTTGEIFSAQFQQNNILGSLASSKSLRYGLFGGDETPISDDDLNKGIVDAGLHDYADRFLDTTTRGHFEAVKADIQRERENNEVIANGGMTGFAAGLVAGFLDVPTLLPIGHALKLGRVVGEAAPSILQTAGRLAATSAIDATATEAALQGIQQTRTAEESAINIGGSILFTTAVGTGIARAVNSATAKRVGDRLAVGVRELQDGTVAKRAADLQTRLLTDTTENQATPGGSLVAKGQFGENTPGNPYDGTVPGAREALNSLGEDWDVASRRMSPDQLALADTLGIAKGAQKIENSIFFGGNLTLNGITSRFASVREYITNLTPMPIALRGNAEGVNTPQSAVAMRSYLDGHRAVAVRSFDSAYRQFRKGVDLTGKDLAKFSRLVAYANANGDKAPSFMAKNDRAKSAAAYEAQMDMSPNEWRSLSSTERAAVEKGAAATRGFFTEIAESNIKAGLMRRFVLGKPITAKEKTGPQIDIEKNALGEPNAATPRSDGATVDIELPGQTKIGGPDTSAPQLGVRYELRARQDSPESLSKADFLKAARKGNLNKRSRVIRPEVSERAGDYEEFDVLKNVDELLNEGLSPQDVARNYAHHFAMTRDADYKRKFNEYLKDKLFRKYAKGRMTAAVKKDLLENAFAGDQKSYDQFIKALDKFKKTATVAEKRQPNLSKKQLEDAHDELLRQKADYESSPRFEVGDITKPKADLPEEAEFVEPFKGELTVAERAAANKDVDEFFASRVKDGKTNVDPDALVNPATYLKHVYRSDRIVHEEGEFIRGEALAWQRQWEQLNDRRIDGLPKAAKIALIRRSLMHAKGTFRAIVHGVDSEGQQASGSIQGKGNLRGSVLERNVYMDSRELLKRGWIEDDVLHLMDRALRQNGTDAVLAMKFRRPPTIREMNLALKRHPDAYWIDGDDATSVPDLAMAEPHKRLQIEVEDALRDARTEAEQTAIKEEGARMHALIDDSVNITRGRYSPDAHSSASARTLGVVRDFTFAAKMGNIILNSLPDAPLQIMEHGLSNVARFTVKRAKTRLSELLSNADEKTIRQIRREARAAGVAIETENLSRVTAAFDTNDMFSSYARATPMERLGKSFAHGASRVFGITYWNNMNQRIGFGIFSDRLSRIALERNTMTAADKRWLAHHGIGDRAFLDGVAANMVANRQSQRGGLYYPEPSAWDAATRNRFYAAARDSNRSTVITPELLEKPLNLHGPTGSTLLQFTGFVMASTLRVTAQSAARLKVGGAAERADIAVAMSGMMAASALSIYLRFLAADRLGLLPDFEENKGWWIYEMADRSGLLGVFSHISNLAESVGVPGPRSMLQNAFDDADKNRIGATAKSLPREPAAALAGPFALTTRDALTVGRDVWGSALGNLGMDIPDNKRIGASTVRSALRLTPIVNGAQFRSLITNPVEQYIDENILGVPYDSR